MTNEERARQAMLNKMTNWQRNQASKACEGSFRDLTLAQLETFTTLPHHTKRGGLYYGKT